MLLRDLRCARFDPLPLVQEGLGLAAEHGFFFRRAGSLEWDTRSSVEEMSWRSIVGPILQQYTESTDGSYVEKKESAFVWHYAAADPDFGSLQVRTRFPATFVQACRHKLAVLHRTAIALSTGWQGSVIISNT